MVMCPASSNRCASGFRHVRGQPLAVCVGHGRVLPTGPDGSRYRDAAHVEPPRRREGQPVVADADHSLGSGPVHALGQPLSQLSRVRRLVGRSQSWPNPAATSAAVADVMGMKYFS